jgi:two-component sensor histidine kinase
MIVIVVSQPIYDSGTVLTLREKGFVVKKVIPHSPAGRTGLEEGVLISQFNGIDAKELSEMSVSSYRDFLIIASALFTRGEKVTLIDEAGETYQFSIGKLPLTKKAPLIQRTFFLNALIGIVMVLVGMYFFLRGRPDRPLRFFLLFTAFAGAAVTVSFFHSYWSLPVLKLRFVSLDLTGTAAGACFIIFSRSFPQLKRTRFAIEIPLLAFPLICKYFLFAVTPLQLFGPASYLIHGYVSLTIIVGILFFIWTYRKSNEGERRKLRWIFLGAVCSVLPYLMYLIYLMVLRNYIGLTFLARFNQIASFFLLLFPLSTGIGITRSNFVDVDQVLKLAVRFLLICLFFTALLAFSYFLFRGTSPLLFFIFVIFAAGISTPVIISQIDRLSNRLIYKKQLFIHELYTLLERELIIPRSTPGIYAMAANTLMNIYIAEYVLFFQLADGDVMMDFFMHYQKKKWDETAKKTAEKTVSQNENLMGPVAIEHGGALVPIHTHKARKPYLLIGKRLDHDVFLKEDLRQLTSLSFQLAQALDNAALYEELNGSLREKELMLQEIHHRVKNNMQVMSSILSLQAEYADNREISGLLNEACSRIDSMALIHETLYQSQIFGEIDMHDYLESVVFNLRDLYTTDLSLDIRLQISETVLPLEYAIPCGLIVNELVSNALKHAFKGRKKGTIVISIGTKGGEQEHGEKGMVLRVENDGTEFPSSVDIENPPTLGLKLVQILARQIHGEVKLSVNPGTVFSIPFSVYPPLKAEAGG